jgi:hypothetical protein
VWAEEALEAARATNAQVDVRAYFTAYGTLVPSTIGLLHLDPGEQAFFRPWAKLGTSLLRCRIDPVTSTSLRGGVSGLLRRAGDLEEAVRVLDGISEDREGVVLPNRGLAQRALGKWDDASATFAELHRQTGSDHFQLEIARVLFDADRHREAKVLFDRFAAKESEESIGAELLDELLDPSRPRVWTRLLGDGGGYDSLRRWTLGHAAYEPMCDAGVNLIAQLKEDPPPLEVKATLNIQESASVLLALAVRVTGKSDPRPLNYTAMTEPSPNPFEPLDRSRGFRLWERSGKLVTQGLTAPSSELSAMVDDLVRDGWTRPSEHGFPMLSVDRAWARILAIPQLDALDPQEVLACMIHSGPPPRWKDTAAWVFDRHVVSALVLAAQDRGKSWLASRRRRSLSGLILGLPDWTTAAGLVAARRVLRETADAQEDVRAWCGVLLDNQPDVGHVPWAPALRELLKAPGMPAHEVKRIAFFAGEKRAG